MNNNPPVEKKPGKSSTREYTEAILTAVFIALFIRSFGIEAFKIPSSSMVPTLVEGDHIFVNKFIYGFRIPLTKIRFWEYRRPQRGEVIVFMYPRDERKDYIKRVIGLPGDSVKVEEEDIYVNGEKVARRGVEVANSGNMLSVTGSSAYRKLPMFSSWRQFDFFEEKLGADTFIAQYGKYGYHSNGTFEVPKEHYFVMGDNRDNSADSREWGFVPFDNVKGKAMFIWLSLNKEKGGIRLARMGKWIR